MAKPITICWFRRDLRLHDQVALSRALQSGHPVVPLFIFDSNILDDLRDNTDARVGFIHDTITGMHEKLKAYQSGFLVKTGDPLDVFKSLVREYEVAEVYYNKDFEPYAKDRDQRIRTYLEGQGIKVRSFKDHVILAGEEVRKDDGSPYVVFTPYKRKWLEVLKGNADTPVHEAEALQPRATKPYFDHFFRNGKFEIPSLEEIGFKQSTITIPDKDVSPDLIREYDKKRNFPGIRGTSRLGVHFRFGTISIRAAARRAAQLNMTYLNELIWRDFYSMILDHFPQVVTQAFRPKYDRIAWRNDQEDFEAWCAGKTGYPLVDAGMRELNRTGYMHNRVRMVTASFLTKHLLIDWRWGEQYFAEKLLDYDLASNNGGWQWAAGSGTDAAPYFRIFNPTSQLKKFDQDLRYVRKWVPEFGSDKYPDPVVEHKFARERCLQRYKAALQD